MMMSHKLVTSSGSYSARVGPNGTLCFVCVHMRASVCVCVYRKWERKLTPIIAFMFSLCLSGKLFDFTSRCTLNVSAIVLSNSLPLKAWQHACRLIRLSPIQQYWLLSFWLPHNGMCMFAFSSKHKSLWCLADNVPNCPHPLFSTPCCALIHSQLGRGRWRRVPENKHLACVWGVMEAAVVELF